MTADVIKAEYDFLWESELF